ncbi:MAG: hypothetical protein PVJ67_03960 [Candidatus Pacearchaeota archaeon]|jgi:hypothetical protein
MTKRLTLKDFKHIKIDIYDFDLYILFNKNWKNLFANFLEENHNYYLDIDKCGYALTTFIKDIHRIYLIFNENPNANSVIHESIHAALYIIYQLDINLDKNNQEPFAYLASFIATKICEISFNIHNNKSFFTKVLSNLKTGDKNDD